MRIRMLRLLHVLLCTGVGVAVFSQTAIATESYRNRKRPLVVFAPAADNPGLTRQRNIINGNRTQLLDRDVVIVYVTGNSVSHDLGVAQNLSASALRQRYKVSEGQFRVMLFGKDGVQKFDQPIPLSSSDLIAEIDRMPTRRDEVRRRGNL